VFSHQYNIILVSSIVTVSMLLKDTEAAYAFFSPPDIAQGIGVIVGGGGDGGATEGGMRLVDELLGKTEDVMDLTDAARDLSDEMNVSEEMTEELDTQARRLEEVDRNLSKVKSTDRATRDFLRFDIHRAKTLAGKLRMVSRKIREGRAILNLFNGGSSKKAAIKLQVEEIKISQRLLDETRSLRLMMMNEYLMEQERDARLKIKMQEILESESRYKSQKKKHWQSAAQRLPARK